MAFLRSLIHFLYMFISVIPWALFVVVTGPFVSSKTSYKYCRAWLASSIKVGEVVLGIQDRITGFENLPQGGKDPAILLVKHQSTWETFLMPAIMPHQLAYVFKRELIYIPFFGWAMATLDMIHINRSNRSEAFNLVIEDGKRLLAEGTWIIMFPEGTRIPRGKVGKYKLGGTRLACATGAPVVPIAVTTARVWPKKAFIKKPGIVDVSIGKPIPSVGREPDELMQEVQDWIESEMRRLDPEAYK